MAEIVYVLGQSGTGKSRSIKNLDPNKTLIIDVGDKSLPFKNEWKDFSSKEKTGNVIHSSDMAVIKPAIKFCEDNMKFDTYVIDDFQFLMSFEYFERGREAGYQKFTDIGQKIYNLIKQLKKELPKNKIVFILGHTEETFVDNKRMTKIKTIGKMLDEKLTLESLATVTLGTMVERDIVTKKLSYYFVTQNDGSSTLKSPEDMFDDFKIPNDLEYVRVKIVEYYPNIFNK